MSNKLERKKSGRPNDGFGKSLKARRNRLRLTLSNLSMTTGMSRTTIFNIEHGIDTSVSSLLTYVKALGGKLTIDFPPAELYPWKDDYYKVQKNKKKED